MKRVKQLLILSCLCLYAGVSQAQVTIGSETSPNTFSVLELISNQKRGLRLPQLTTAQRDALNFTGKVAEAKGLMIYNTTTNCVETWNGTVWISTCASDPAPACEPTTNISITANTVWQQHKNGSFVFELTTDGSLSGLVVDWYADGAKVATTEGTRFFTYTPGQFGPSYTVQAKVRETCSVASQPNIPSNIVTVSVGCGAYTTGGNWLVFMCHNLGADTSLNPFTYKSDGNAIDFDIKGYLYQWGRPSDGHQSRSSNTTETLATSNIPGHSNFITTNASPNDWRSGGGNEGLDRWGDGTTNVNPPKAANDPCPQGWKIPSQAQWQSIFKSSGSDSPSNATANEWTWTGNGYKVGQGLFLPAAGYRQRANAVLNSVDSHGYYWSSTIYNGVYSHSLFIHSGAVNPVDNGVRGNGLSVRCVSE